jgi:glutamate-1-semialdehyde 2,1-aminomutase
VYQAGTLSGNPLATAAGLAVLDRLDAGASEELTATATDLADGLRAGLGDGAVTVPQVGPLVGLFFGSAPVTNYDEAKASCGTDQYPALFNGLLDRGVAFAPGPYEALFPSLAHTAEDIERTVEAVAAAAAAAVAAAAPAARD